jgi:hypothetical protein
VEELHHVGRGRGGHDRGADHLVHGLVVAGVGGVVEDAGGTCIDI